MTLSLADILKVVQEKQIGWLCYLLNLPSFICDVFFQRIPRTVKTACIFQKCVWLSERKFDKEKLAAVLVVFDHMFDEAKGRCSLLCEFGVCG